MRTHLVGTATMVRLVLRRDRVRLPVWVLSILGVLALSAVAVASTYTTREQILAYQAVVGGSPAAVAMSGPPVALDTMGGILVYETSVTALLGAALMSVFLVVRHTRGDEEEGRSELLRSTVLGRYAHSAATLAVLLVANVVLGVGTTLSVLAGEVPLEGAAVYGAAVTAFGLVMAAVATVTAQVMTHARGAVGLALAVLGAAFLLRAVGDTGDGRLSWLSPMGWSQQVRAFDDDRWWPLGLSLGLAVLLLGVAVVLMDHRDLGAGLVPPRPGPPDASPWLRGPVSLAVRLQRGTVVGWAAGVFVFGLAFGSMSEALEELVDTNPVFAEYFAAAGGGSLVDSFFATALLVMSLATGGFAVSSVLRARTEETSWRLEPMLATALSRRRWLLGNLLVTAAGTAVVVAAAGLGVGVGHAVASDAPGSVLPLVGHALVYVPAALVLAAVAVLLVGAAPRLAPLSWLVVAFCFVVGWLGGLLAPPRWVTGLSPFTHTPAAPAESVTGTPVVVLLALAVALAAAGVLAFERRDIG